jgi:hypothetical protein
MAKRIPRVYFSEERQDRKAILVFDAGHDKGTVYVYERKEAILIEDIEKEMKELYQYEIPQENLVFKWVEFKFGFPMQWKLTSE